MAFRISNKIKYENCCTLTKEMKSSLFNIIENQKKSDKIYIIRNDSESKYNN